MGLITNQAYRRKNIIELEDIAKEIQIKHKNS